MTTVNTLLRTDAFASWLEKLSDARGKARVLARLDSAALSEMRIHTGPGYRVYYTRSGRTIYLLLLGGDKSTQARDIERAITMARDLEEGA